MYGWTTRPTKVEIKSWYNDDAVVDIGRYRVTIPGLSKENPPEITYVTESRSSTDPRRTFPNMSVEDGVLKIYVEDIVDEMLTRLDPVDLARQLWQNDKVREAFMECMTERYSEGLTDQDRHKFLRDVQATVHDQAVYHLSEKFNDSEYNLTKSAFFWDQVHRANNALSDAEKMVRNQLGQTISPEPDDPTAVFRLPRLRDDGQDPIFKISGTAWNEARDYWRTKVSELFPGPEEPQS